MALPAMELVAATSAAGHFRFACMRQRVLALCRSCPWEVRAAVFGGFTSFSGDVRVRGWCLITGTVSTMLMSYGRSLGKLFWKKQLVIAKDVRRLDVLCHRIFLSHKVLASTEKYLSLHEIVDTALKKLEAEVGPLSGAPNMGRGIVSRLVVGAEVQKLCAQAIDAMESMFCGASPVDPQMQRSAPSDFIKFESVTQTSATVVLDLEKCPVLAEQVVAFNKSIELGSWEVKMKTSCQKEDPRGLMPVGVVLEQNTESPKTNSDGQSDPSSEGVDSNNNTAVYADLNKSPESDFEYCENPEILDSDKASHHPGEHMDDLQNIQMGAARVTEVMELEEAPGLSASALDEEPNPITQAVPLRESSNSVEHNQTTDAPGSQDASNAPVVNGSITDLPRLSGSVPPTAPRGTENGKENNARSFKGQPGDNIVGNGSSKPEREPGNSSNKRTGKLNDISCKDGCPEASYEYCVKVVRWLECEGYIETHFRMKFLSWFSLRATPHERKIVSVYVDTLIDDPVSLSGQLVDSFSEAIHSKKRSSLHSGFCMDLWH
ncbi:hypothetical protein PR202_gb06245 [Eleusine coracana subsp. coracana]|uniref:VIN3-like C-terminal domain-containing protein n=1 Tax=Eleusine coracana subsp. coracana TaxID=191504 RepID=A0AAV5E9U6_ELECO|nr:hypothetical protein PR202_gb06245 [Eleusine coracana subsp. coracana]